MRIAIVGSGSIGKAIARRLSHSGNELLMSNKSGPESLTGQVAEIGPSACAVTVPEGVELSEVAFIAVPYYAIDEVAAAVPDWRGKIVVDVTNYYASRDGDELDPGEHSSSSIVAGKFKGARVVKAFNTIPARRLERELHVAGSEPDVVFYAGDDPVALQTVADLIKDAGCTPVRTGSLAEGGKRQEPGSDIYGFPLTKTEAEERLRRAG
jgi:8-hydroxy-5-deazaflavin:NADPH oxidoreductase